MLVLLSVWNYCRGGVALPDLQGSKITKILRNSGRGNPSPTEEKVPPTNLIF
jgi:hypothetical protein